MQVHRMIAAGLLALGLLLSQGVVSAWDDAKVEGDKPAAEATSSADTEQAQPTGQAEPTAEAPAGETPAAEAPAAEAPAADANAPEAPANEAEAPATETPAAEEPADEKHADEKHAEGDHGKTAHTGEKHADDTHAAGEHAEGDHAHDEFDISHANATAALEKPEELRFELAVGTFAVFVVLLAILVKFAWGPIVSGLDKREKGIADMIENARIANEQAAAKLREHEAKLAIAADEARAMLVQARTDAEAAREKIVSEAQAAAARERDRAVADIATAKSIALKEIAEKSVETALSLAGNIVRREIKPEDHEKLITEALNQFPTLN